MHTTNRANTIPRLSSWIMAALLLTAAQNAHAWHQGGGHGGGGAVSGAPMASANIYSGAMPQSELFELGDIDERILDVYSTVRSRVDAILDEAEREAADLNDGDGVRSVQVGANQRVFDEITAAGFDISTFERLCSLMHDEAGHADGRLPN